jgi:ornithine cyclodeaminase/alanine dehydrogenase-like protein (mu-crystallin family)
MSLPAVRLLRRGDVLRCLEGADLLEPVRAALIAAAEGRARTPQPMSFEFGERREAHVKGAYLEGSGDWTVKLATGFYDNAEVGLPTASGMSLLSSAETGVPTAIVLDGGLLTDVRTAAAGTLAVEALGVGDVERVAVVGCGTQARLQLESLATTRSLRRVVVFGRHRERASRCALEMSERLGLEVEATDEARAAVEAAEVVFTVTPSRRPLVEADWLEPGATVIAVGADMPGKQELAPLVLERAELLAADDPEQALALGELQHAPTLRERARALGDLLASPPRREGGVAVADLTGVGAEDAAVAALVVERAEELGVGETIAVE